MALKVISDCFLHIKERTLLTTQITSSSYLSDTRCIFPPTFKCLSKLFHTQMKQKMMQSPLLSAAFASFQYCLGYFFQAHTVTQPVLMLIKKTNRNAYLSIDQNLVDRYNSLQMQTADSWRVYINDDADCSAPGCDFNLLEMLQRRAKGHHFFTLWCHTLHDADDPFSALHPGLTHAIAFWIALCVPA